MTADNTTYKGIKSRSRASFTRKTKSVSTLLRNVNLQIAYEAKNHHHSRRHLCFENYNRRYISGNKVQVRVNEAILYLNTDDYNGALKLGHIYILESITSNNFLTYVTYQPISFHHTPRGYMPKVNPIEILIKKDL